MLVTNNDIATKIFDYLNHRIILSELVDWCGQTLLSDEITFENNDTAMEVITKIGLADVDNFVVSWEEWQYFLEKLNYKIKVDYIHLAA